MPSHPSEWLAEMRLARFGADAAEFLSRYRAWSAERSLVTERPDFAQDYVELGAVEFALAPRIVSAALELQPVISPALPVDILPTHLGLAALKTNCGPFVEHRRKAPDELQPWDMFTFAGDMSKAELLEVRNINDLATLKSMERFVARLAKRYEDAGLGPALVDSGLLSAQGIVWFAKLALLRGEDPSQARNLRFAESLPAHPDKPSLTTPPAHAPKDLSAKLDELQQRAAQAKQAAQAAVTESREQLRQRIDQAKVDVDQAAKDVQQDASAATASVMTKWAQMKADATAKMDDLQARIDKRADQLDADAAASEAEWAEDEAAAAIDYAAWTVDNVRLAVLDAIDARAYADEFARTTGS